MEKAKNASQAAEAKNAATENKDSKTASLKERHLNAINSCISTKGSRASALQRFKKVRKLDSIEVGSCYTFSKGLADAFTDDEVKDNNGKVSDVIAKFTSDEGRKLRATTLLGQSGLSNFIAKGSLVSESDNNKGEKVETPYIANSAEGWYDANNMFTIPEGEETLLINAETEEEALEYIEKNLTYPCKLTCVSKPIKGFTTTSASPANCWQKWGVGYQRVITAVVFKIESLN